LAAVTPLPIASAPTKPGRTASILSFLTMMLASFATGLPASAINVPAWMIVQRSGAFSALGASTLSACASA